MISKIQSIRVSERVLDIVSEILDVRQLDGWEIDGYLSTFNNCREEGFYLTAYNRNEFLKGEFFAWVTEARNSADIMVVISTEPDRPTVKGMFSESAYNNAKYFECDEEHQAANYIVEQIGMFFNL